ncbi:MAG: porin family protein [Bryobacteraceae bacterium]|jgi:opacity protein-like surface antigen
MRGFLPAIFLLSQAAFAQPVSIGIRGGVPFTGAFSDVTTSSSGSEFVRQFSASDEYLIGPMVELHLPLGFSVEADALYHPLDLTQEINNGTSTFRNSTLISSWEFPILAKYHFLPFPLLKPYVEAGPSFRATGGAVSNYLSKAGFTVGAGVEIKFRRLHLEPELRYIRWGADANLTYGQTITGVPAPATNLAASNLNQVQFLVGIAF